MNSALTWTRRRLLQSSLQAASYGAAAALLPAQVRQVLAMTPNRVASLRDIRHVVLLMQENRSFDHYFGALAGVRGFNDPHAMRLPNGRSVFQQPDAQNPQGFLLPFHLDTQSTAAQKLPSTSHAWSVQHRAWNGGKMDQWVAAHRKADGAHGPYTMGYFKRQDIPFHYALAEAFTVCDAYHSSVMGPTWPNRLMYFTGTIDPDGRAGGPMINNKAPPEGLRWTTYAERLQEADISWRVYPHGHTGAGFNLLREFRQFKDAVPGSPLRQRGMPEAMPGEFEYDALHDRLPTVSWLCPTYATSEHPNAMPAAGADLIASKLNAVAANPQVWAKTVFILNYDENDGLFDHVAPPVPPEGTAQEWVRGLPIGGGFRVPCIVISPWTAGGWVCSQPFDHTSVLQFLERFTGVREPNISEWRRQTFGDMTSVFRWGSSADVPPSWPDTKSLLRAAKENADQWPLPAIPGAGQSFPQQEKGARQKVPRSGV
jgi:phospholipase C